MFKYPPFEMIDDGDSVKTEHIVNPTNLPTAQCLFCGDGIEFGDEEISFIADTANFTNYEKAKEALAGVVLELQNNPSETIEVIAYRAHKDTECASGIDDVNTSTAQERAEAVKNLLVNIGIGESRINAYAASGFRYEDCSNGQPVPPLQEKNRVVVIKATRGSYE